MFCRMFVSSGTEVRFVSGVGEEVDEGYLETNANLVSAVSTLSPFCFSYRHSHRAGPIYHVPNSAFILSTAARTSAFRGHASSLFV